MGVTTVSVLDLGLYEAGRAAALTGVPRSTLYEWARTGLIVPSGSAQKEKLWSYADLLTLRLVRWLRSDKPTVTRTRMADVRRALGELGEALWTEDADGGWISTIRAMRDGTLVIIDDLPRTVDGQLVLDDALDLFAPMGEGVDLRQPRRHLRIHPGRVAGEPHLHGSRLTSRAVAGLVRRGLDLGTIAELYPRDERAGIKDAIDLELQLGGLEATA